MQARVLKSVGRVLAFAILALLPVALAAQSAPAAKGSSNQSPSRWDIFAGYSYLAPKRQQSQPPIAERSPTTVTASTMLSTWAEW